jgi:zinc protease
MKLKLPVILLLFIHVSISLVAQPTPVREADRQPMDEEVYHGFLPNGLAYYVRKNAAPKKRAVLYLVERAGSLQEDDDQLGVAHFIEHMAFKGTRTLPKDELISYLQKSGVKFGADFNARTSFDQTSYELTLPTDSMQVFKKGLDILTDWAGFVSFDANDVNSERGVILEEARLREKTANGRMNSQTAALEYNHSRFAERPVIGTEEIIKNVKPETLLRFYRDWYRPNEQAVIIVGDFNPRQVVQLLKEKFSVLKNPIPERKLVDYAIPPVSGTRVKILTDKETPYTYFSMTVRLPGTLERTNDEYMDKLRSTLLNYMLNNRISDIIKKGNPPFLNASAFNSPSLGHTDIFTTRINAKPGELESSIKTIITELESAKKYGFTGTEFKTAKAWRLRNLGSSFYNLINHPSSSYADEYRRNFLQDEGIPGLAYEYDITKNNIEQISLAQINSLMIPYTSTDNRVILLEAPANEAAALPDEKTLLSWIDHPDTSINAYQDVKVDNTVDLLPDRDIKWGKVDTSFTDDVAGTETYRLSNGARVIVKNLNLMNGQILFDVYGFGGTSLAPDADYTSASLAGQLVSKSGLDSFNQVELDKLLTNKPVGVAPYISDYLQGIRGGAAQSNIVLALKLIHLYFTAPRKDSTVWNGLISQQKALLVNEANSPLNIFGDTARAVLHNYNIRGYNATPALLNAASMDKAFNYYKERFADAGNFTFIFVGNTEGIGMRGLIRKYIGSLPGTNSHQGLKDLNMNPPAGKITKIIHKGIDDKSTVELLFHGTFDYNEENNLQLNALGEILQIKLTQRLRLLESGVYSPRAAAYYLNYPNGQYKVMVQFTCSAANVKKLIDATLDEVNKIKQNGALPTDIQKFVADETRATELKIKQNGFWIQHLSSGYQNKEDPGKIFNYVSTLKHVTVESTKAAANKYLNDDNFIKLVLLPEKFELTDK